MPTQKAEFGFWGNRHNKSAYTKKMMYIYEKPFFRSTLFDLQHDTQIMEIRHSCTVLQIGC